jgi:hypothetical protein
MRNTLLVVAALALVACKKTGDNQYEVVRPGLVTDTVSTPTVGTTTDTVSVPTVKTVEDTLIVKKPVVETKQTEIKRPTTKRP